MKSDDQDTLLRERALDQAIRFVDAVSCPEGLTLREAAHGTVRIAEIFFRWNMVGLRTDLLVLTASTPYRANGTASPLIPGESIANPQVPVSYQFDLTVAPVDVLGNPVADTLTWTNSDTTGATTLTVDDATTLKVTVAVTGVASDVVITATDPSGLTGSYTFDAVADVATSLSLTPSAPVKTPTA